jgi:hypothetical protein
LDANRLASVRILALIDAIRIRGVRLERISGYPRIDGKGWDKLMVLGQCDLQWRKVNAEEAPWHCETHSPRLQAEMERSETKFACRLLLADQFPWLQRFSGAARTIRNVSVDIRGCTDAHPLGFDPLRGLSASEIRTRHPDGCLDHPIHQEP